MRGRLLNMLSVLSLLLCIGVVAAWLFGFLFASTEKVCIGYRVRYIIRWDGTLFVSRVGENAKPWRLPFPVVLLAIGICVARLLRWMRSLRQRRLACDPQFGPCPACGYYVCPMDGRCPECGTPIPGRAAP